MSLDDPLAHALKLQPPTSPDKAPSILSMSRRREIEIDWHSLLSEGDRNTLTNDLNSILEDDRNIKEYFLSVWEEKGYPRSWLWANFLVKRGELFDKGEVVYRDPATSKLTKTSVDVFLIVSKKKHGDDNHISRVYVPLDSEGKPVRLDPDGTDFDYYLVELWPLITSLAIGYLPTDTIFAGDPAEAEIRKVESRVESESRESIFVRSEFDRLNALVSLSTKLKETAEAKIAAETEMWWDDPSKIVQGEQKYLQFSARGALVKDQMLELQKRAAAFGYYLCIENEVRKSRDDAGTPVDISLTPGSIYREYYTSVRWSTSVTLYRTVVRRGSCGKVRVDRVPEVRTYHHHEVVPRFELIKQVNDPIQDKINSLRDQGYVVFVFREQADGFISEKGERLTEITYRCGSDEEFRRRCVCVFPEYDSIFSGFKYELRNIFFFHPLPGMFPTEFPKASIEEELSYTIQWVHSELGQLVNTISLAPGEERNIVVATSYKRDVTNASSLSRSNELSIGSSQDFATEIENEASREFAKSKSSSASGSAGFSYGGFGAKASASQTTTTSLKNFSRSLRKVARKAARNMNRKISQEVTTSTTEVISMSTSEQTTLNVKNINEGRTLNIMFYQINNMFNGGLYVDDLKLSIKSGREVIAGSGIYESYVFPLHQLDVALEQFSPDKLPISIPYEDGAFVSYWNSLIDTLIDVLSDEYATTIGNDSKNSARSCCVMNLDTLDTLAGGALTTEEQQLDALAVFKQRSGPTEDRSSLGKKFAELKLLLEEIVVSEEPLVPDQLLVASGGVYSDSIVGKRPATEPYAERMRDLETVARKAEIEHTVAKTDALKARTKLLFDEDAPHIVSGNFTYVGTSSNFTGSLQFNKELDDGDWLALYESEPISIEFSNEMRSASVSGDISSGLDTPQFLRGLLLLERRSGSRVVSIT
jgi:hypothetical protein